MKRLFLLFLLTLPCWAQTTNVTGTITDPLGQVWYGGTYNFQLQFSDGSSQAFYNGNPLPSSNYIVKGVMDGTGSFATTLYDNNRIAPANTYWRATICSNTASPVQTTGGTTTFVCFTKDITIAGASQSLTTTLSAATPTPLVNALLTPSAYNSAELSTSVLLGGMYWDLNTGCIMVWNGTSWGCIGSGGNTFVCPTAINGAVLAATSPTTYGCDRAFLTDFFGHATAQSFATVSPYNGEEQFTATNAWQPSALPTSTESWIAPNVIPVPFRNVLPPAPCIDGQLLGQQSHDIDPTGTARVYWNCQNGLAVSLTGTSPIVVTPSPTTGTGVISCPTCSTSLANVQSVSAGNLAPVFTTSVANPTTTPAITFSLSNAAANTIFSNFTAGSAAPAYNAIANCGDSTHALSYIGGTGFGCQTLAAPRYILFSITNSVGLTAGTTSASYDLVSDLPACTIQQYTLGIDTGTITVKFWKIADGTAIPTVANSISTSGVGISSGTRIRSTTLSDFITTTINADDSMIMDITAVSGATTVTGVIKCQ